MTLTTIIAAAIVVVVVVSAAPPSPLRSSSSSSSSSSTPLLRPKRGNTPPKSATIPYSSYRGVTGAHRYRYPLYQKRNLPVHYDYEDDLYLPEDEVEAEDYSTYNPRPSLFRERNFNQQHQMEEEEEEEEIAALEEALKEERERRENELLLENRGYFHELPEMDLSRMQLQDASNSPYALAYPDVQRLNRMYQMEKAQESLLPYGTTQGTMAPTATGRFYDALSYVRKRATEFKPYTEGELRTDTSTPPRAKKPQQYLTSAAGRYWRVRDEQEQQEAQQKTPAATSSVTDQDMMIRRRRKRHTTTGTSNTPSTTTTTTTSTTSTTPAAKRRKTNTPAITLATKTPPPPPPPHHTTTTTTPHRDHRNKRAFSDYFKWEKRGDQEEEEQEEEEQESDNKDIDDYLTREYFKTIARSVAQKRMAYGRFEPEKEEEQEEEKRASVGSLEDILKNPATLRLVQDKLREAEILVAQEAGTGLSQWPRGGTQDEAAQKLLSNLVLRMDAIEHMREALSQLENLQENRAGKRVGGRREIQLMNAERKRIGAAAAAGAATVGAAGAGGRSQKRIGAAAAAGAATVGAAGAGGGGRSGKRSARRRLRREDVSDLFLGNEREECPVLWLILQSCNTVSEKVGDEAQVFLPACIKHEICYVCGASQGISGHECDAVLSSALEASCPARSLDCLAAAGSTFTALSRPAAYDPAGSCANDPCVIHFLESR